MKLDDPHGFDPRNKVVSFRLSDGEYELAQEFCKASGYRGMSMLARSAFLAYMPHKPENGVEDDPALLQTELKSLHMELAKLIASLSKIRQHLAPESHAPETPAPNTKYMEASGSSIS
jgi:hypothetical protein